MCRMRLWRLALSNGAQIVGAHLGEDGVPAEVIAAATRRMREQLVLVLMRLASAQWLLAGAGSHASSVDLLKMGPAGGSSCTLAPADAVVVGEQSLAAGSRRRRVRPIDPAASNSHVDSEREKV